MKTNPLYVLASFIWPAVVILSREQLVDMLLESARIENEACAKLVESEPAISTRAQVAAKVRERQSRG